jgi:putative methyltransferase (TIGR04325 family)
MEVIRKVKNILFNRQRPVEWYGKFKSYSEVKKISGGYDSSQILEKVSYAVNKVKDGEVAYERDSVLFEKIQYNWPLLAILGQIIASKKGERVHILDFGGSLGSTYFAVKDFLKPFGFFSWSIVEQESFVAEGRKKFESSDLNFYFDIDECILKKGTIDIVLFSGVLEYIENFELILNRVKEYNIKHIIFDRTPVAAIGEGFWSLQKVPSSIYKASYPCYIFPENFFLKEMENYKIVYEFDGLYDGPTMVNNNLVRFKGFYFQHSPNA